jgi:uncharacterized protein
MPFVSPGVYWRELDYSDYVPALATSVIGVVGGATWGPMNDDKLVTNEGDLFRTFGFPVKDDMGLYASQRYLRRGVQLKYCRVGTAAAAKAAVMVPDLTPANVMEIEALYHGTVGNGLVVELVAAPTAGRYNLIVSTIIDPHGTRGDVETFQDLSVSDPMDDRYIETVVNEGTRDNAKSQWIVVDVINTALTPVVGTYTLVGGNDGITGLTSADYIGTVFGQNATGLQVFANSEKTDINLLMVPGVADPAVILEMGEICEKKRRDSFGIVDSPFGLTVEGVVDWHNGAAPYTHAAFNNSYLGLYWPWIQIYDAYTRAELWTPPSGFVAESIAYTDFIAEPWFAPAGFNRGRISALRTEYSPDQGQRDYMYGNQNAVNPIVSFPKDGIAIWGQRTLQRKPSALDRVNVRRLMLTIEKQIATAVKYLVFEPNDPITWKRFVNLVTPAMDWVKARRGVYDFRVICDESTNPPIAIDRNEMYGKVLLKPTKAAEMIIIDFTILPTGANFATF